MSKLKKIVATLMATATVASLSVSAFAVDYKHPGFDFDLGKGGSACTKETIKQDSLDYAMVNCKEGNVDNVAHMWMCIYGSHDMRFVTNSINVTTLNNYRFDYNDGTYAEGWYYQLTGSTDTYSAYVKGKWDP